MLIQFTHFCQDPHWSTSTPPLSNLQELGKGSLPGKTCHSYLWEVRVPVTWITLFSPWLISFRHVLPWLVLKSDTVWVGAGAIMWKLNSFQLNWHKTVCTGNQIDAYSRLPPAYFVRKGPKKKQRYNQPTLRLTGGQGDFGRFVVSEGVVVAGDT